MEKFIKVYIKNELVLSFICTSSWVRYVFKNVHLLVSVTFTLAWFLWLFISLAMNKEHKLVIQPIYSMFYIYNVSIIWNCWKEIFRSEHSFAVQLMYQAENSGNRNLKIMQCIMDRLDTLLTPEVPILCCGYIHFLFMTLGSRSI